MKNNFVLKKPLEILILALLALPILISAVNDTDFEKGFSIMNEGVVLLQNKNYSLATNKFLHCLEFGHRYGKKFADIQRSFLLQYLERAITADPESRRKALAAFQRLLEKGMTFSIHSNELGILAETGSMLNAEDRLVAMYDSMLQSQPEHGLMRSTTEELFHLLYKHHRYKEIAKHIDLVKKAQSEMKRYEDKDNEMFRKFARKPLILKFTQYIEVCTQSGCRENAAQIRAIRDKLSNHP